MYSQDYFTGIVKRLSWEDLSILGYLQDEKATAPFKAISKKEIAKELRITDANIRKAIYRLDIVNFVEFVQGIKEQKLYITNIGMFALQQSLEEEGVEV